MSVLALKFAPVFQKRLVFLLYANKYYELKNFKIYLLVFILLCMRLLDKFLFPFALLMVSIPVAKHKFMQTSYRHLVSIYVKLISFVSYLTEIIIFIFYNQFSTKKCHSSSQKGMIWRILFCTKKIIVQMLNHGR